VFARALPHVSLRGRMGDGFNALGREVAIAQPAVVLVAGVDDPLDGLAGHLPGGVMDFDTVALKAAGTKLFWATIGQIAVIDIVFSLDSVITAVGMVDQLGVMVAAVVTSVGVMLVAAKPIGEFVDSHPSVKVLALAFLVMVGMALTAEAFDQHVPKGYIYAAMAFSLGVEALNIRARAKRMAAASRRAGLV
jgi:predicted tellurium resistance membrane protein TerC